MPFRYLYQRQSRKILTNQEDIQSRQNYCSTLANKWNFKSEIRRQGVWSFVPQFYTLLISVYWGHLNFDCPALKIDFGFIITYCFQMLFSSLFLELFEKNTYESRIRNHSIHTWARKMGNWTCVWRALKTMWECSQKYRSTVSLEISLG